jgi:acyl-CoA dehydrogenase
VNNDAAGRAEAMLPLLRAQAADLDNKAAFPVAALGELRRNGLLGLLVPVEFGGLGADLTALVDVAQTLATGCLSTAMIWAMHCQQVDALVRHAGPELAASVLPRVSRGEIYLASITTEPGKGGHLLSAGAALDGDDILRVERDAPIVTGGEYADAFLITMRAATDAPEQQVSLVYAERDQLTLDARQGWNPLGMRGTHSVGLQLSGKVPAHQIVGRSGQFRDIAVDSMIVAGHLGWAACWLGTAKSALQDFIALMRSPSHPKPLDPRSDLKAARLARIRIDLELASAYLHRVTAEVSEARRTARSVDTTVTQIHLNTLKVIASELTFRSVDNLVQLAGLGTGYLRDAAIPLERHFRDLRSAALNYANDRLLTTTGSLTLLDRAVRLA